jgi:hypothetical protein
MTVGLSRNLSKIGKNGDKCGKRLPLGFSLLLQLIEITDFLEGKFLPYPVNSIVGPW